MSDLDNHNNNHSDKSPEGASGKDREPSSGRDDKYHDGDLTLENYLDGWISENDTDISGLLKSAGFEQTTDEEGCAQFLTSSDNKGVPEKSLGDKAENDLFLSTEDLHPEDIKPVDFERDTRTSLSPLQKVFSAVVSSPQDEVVRSSCLAMSCFSTLVQAGVMASIFSVPGLVFGIATSIATHVYVDKKYKPHSHSRGMDNYTAYVNRRLTHRAAAKDREANRLRENLIESRDDYKRYLSQRQGQYTVKISRTKLVEIEGPYDSARDVTQKYKQWETKQRQKIKSLYNEATNIRQSRDPSAAPTLSNDPVFPHLAASDKKGPSAPDEGLLKRFLLWLGGNNGGGHDDDTDGGQRVPDNKSPAPAGPSAAVG